MRLTFIYKTLILIPILNFVFTYTPVSAFEVGKCSADGYSVVTINGMFTDDKEAKNNKDTLEFYFGTKYKEQSIKFDYLLNPSHLAGLGDIITAAQQKYFDERAVDGYDLKEMLYDASQKITTQKVLLVGHSQGNFYANSIYDSVADKEGGIPATSLGVYAVATPSGRVAGGGQWITSSNDKIIIDSVQGILGLYAKEPNVFIPPKPEIDKNGHSFSKIYLPYQGARIVDDIQQSLNKLKSNSTQNQTQPCVNPPKLSVGHELAKAAFWALDPFTVEFRNTSFDIAIKTYEVGVATRDLINNYSDKFYAFFNGNNNSASVILATEENISEETMEETKEQVLEPVVEIIPGPVVVEVEEELIVPESEIIVEEVVPEPEIILPTPPETIEEESIPEIIEVVEEDEPVLEVVEEIIEHPDLLPGGGGMSAADIAALATPPPPPPDTTAPVVTLLGSAQMTIAKDSVFVDPGATASDEKDGVITPVITGSVDTATVGVYTLTYTATDEAGNNASIPRIVRVDTGAKLSQPYSVYVSDNYAYIGTKTGFFEIIDISDPVNPVHKSYMSDSGGSMFGKVGGVYVSGSYAYVTHNGGFDIIDITNPVNPVSTARLNDANPDDNALNCSVAVTVSGNYAYDVSNACLNSNTGKTYIADISDPSNPIFKSFIWAPGSPFGNYSRAISVSGNYLYLTYVLTSSMHIVDISDAENPVVKSLINNGAGGASLANPSAISVSGNHAYIASTGDNTLEILDVSDPENPVHAGKISDGDGGAQLSVPMGVYVSGNYAYVVSDSSNALEIINVSDPSNPVHVGAINHGDGGAELNVPVSVFVSGNYAYVVSDSSNHLEIIDISNPASPVHVGKIGNGEFGN